ncbi:class I SAM-dependent methyltransferase [Propionicicella superfundia]|uniref:class I SAM-dependent methyltransferase n=1 Tax=Propionicicella superfundia TaxID=348582 RepID=UPI0003FCFEF3|nr:class I SAM-dependent methyltransferase [Propionicicella superfundia]
MTHAAPLAPPPTPRHLLDRWDAQQTAYVRQRAGRFDVMARVIGHLCPPQARVLDLASGPGSLTRLVRERFPSSTVVALDKDPLLLAIASDVFASDAQVQVVEGDLDTPEWVRTVDGPFDAVISSTALHWLSPDVLARVYGELAPLIAPGGVFLNGDDLLYDATSNPTLRRVAAADDREQQQRCFGDGVDTWDDWWAAASAAPAYAEAVARRSTVWAESGGVMPVSLGFHLEALRSAGFAEVGTVWQHLDDYVVAGIR